ncbi:4-alpha-glucanotransferase [Borrelia turicatae]|uniref:4-alpha-glucanotransferase n=2 Tax=Borrelia turicatae TaxID=142 RepID=A0A172XAQ8_BORTU|nr:4-alpha-glucanotransferase [Borrelia turicatae]AAX17503.1 4-alpha-glucanotransferase [Borrelia turicatae 91E135]ANF33662.1 4-alpha-glucanotransferase [Borrelia turicatae]UPA13034.1 4-alpha-glucanotransferase [Borrelia turicatae 91E135]UPA14521.1 4-alpha-glucanotransferase [Borrelia turicatae]
MKRKSGILLNISSLPSKYGIGDLGRGAYKFIDFLADSSQGYWQILPYSPPSFLEFPYSSYSAFAGNINYIDLNAIDRFIDIDLGTFECLEDRYVDYDKLKAKEVILRNAALNFLHRATIDEIHAFEKFKKSAAYWLLDFSSFVAFKEYYSKFQSSQAFNLLFSREILKRDAKALAKLRETLEVEINIQQVLQYFFFSQFKALKKYANNAGIKIVSDIPIFVSYDSADVWAHQKYFKLRFDASKDKVTGVPPDCLFSKKYLWGNAAYNWKALRKDDYVWWINRIDFLRKYVDIVRIDYFRGFVSTWEVSAEESLLFGGQWVKCPGKDFFKQILNEINDLEIWVEDLVKDRGDTFRLRDYFGFPGTKMMQCAFDFDSANIYLPHNYIRNCVVYTGTHESNTIRGFINSVDNEHKKYIFDYFNTSENAIVWDMIRGAMASVANSVIIPMKDYLDLVADFSMNISDAMLNNFRILSGDLSDDLSKKISDITKLYGRT